MDHGRRSQEFTEISHSPFVFIKCFGKGRDIVHPRYAMPSVKSNPFTHFEDFAALCVDEPRLIDLLERAQAIKDAHVSPSFCANHFWYGCNGCDICNGGLKAKLLRLVGHEADNPQLRTSRAYDIAYDAIYSVLPPCRNCSCL